MQLELELLKIEGTERLFAPGVVLKMFDPKSNFQLMPREG